MRRLVQDAEEGLQAATMSAESKEADIMSMEKAVKSTRWADLQSILHHDALCKQALKCPFAVPGL